jgi:UDP:flavonoid glycosyltransferase YjiC (YdhE family)
MTKENILFIPASIRSHIVPAMYIADFLSEKYEIHFAVTDNILENLVKTNHYNSVKHSGFKPMFNLESDFIINVKKQPLGFWSLNSSIAKNEIFEFRKKELFDIIQNLKPKAVIIDIFSSTDFLVLRAISKELNLFFFNPMLSTYKIPGYPVVSEGFWIKDKPLNLDLDKKNKKTVLSILKSPIQSFIEFLKHKQIQKIFKESGISEKILDKNNGFTKMFRSIPELILAPLEFEVSPNIKQPSQHYLGLCTRTNRSEIELDNSFENKWQTILENKKSGEKIVYCGFGTFYTGPDKTLLTFIENLLKVSNEIGKIQLVVSVNRFVTESIKSIGNSSNIHFFTRVPQLEVLKHTDLFITHGGLGSIKEAIEFEVPMLVYPLDLHYDQNGNGLKVELHQIGLRGNFAFEREQDMKHKIEKLLNDTLFKEKIKAMSNSIKQKYTNDGISQTLSQLGL